LICAAAAVTAARPCDDRRKISGRGTSTIFSFGAAKNPIAVPVKKHAAESKTVLFTCSYPFNDFDAIS